MHPLVSIIVTTYNRCNLLLEAISSIQNQTYKNYECIIIDDGSTDETESYVNEIIDDRIRYIIIPNSGSPAKPRNIGLSKAKAEFVAFCDDDDLWFPDKLECQINSFNDSIIAIGTNAIISNANEKKFNIKEDIILRKNDINLIKSIPLSSLLVKRSEIIFNEKNNFNYSEDFLYKLDLIHRLNKPIKLLCKPLIKYRLNLGVNNGRLLDNEKNSLNVLYKYRNKYKKEIINNILQRTLTSVGITAFRNKSKEYLIFFAKALFYATFTEKINILKTIGRLIVKT